MKFDRTAPGGGIEAACRLENGKAFLEWEFHFQKGDCSGAENRSPQEFIPMNENICQTRCITSEHFDNAEPKAVNEYAHEYIRLRLMDTQGNMVLECIQELYEEERLQSVLLHPQLWNSIENPYLYTLKAFITDREGRCLDRLCIDLPLCSMEMRGADGLLLNGQRFCPKAAAYSAPDAKTGTERQRLIFEDLQRLRELGANCIYVEKEEELTRPFMQLCSRLGFFVLSRSTENSKRLQVCSWQHKWEIEYPENMPRLRGKENNLLMDNHHPTSLFYKYKAKWSSNPFVYIVPESVKRMKSGNYTALCYSSCDRIALYSDGILFELKKGGEEFEFQDIPAKSPCIMLSAEGDGCSTALSIHKTFTNRLLRNY